MIDVAILGSGPAALTAALYTARAGLKTVVYEKSIIGGLTAIISEIENFPAFTGTGSELAEKLEEQATRFGATIEYGECSGILRKDGSFILSIDDEPVEARSIIVATGSEPRKLGIPGEDSGGIHFCATCDGAFYKDKSLVVIGGANSAVQESFFLLQYAKQVTIVSRSPLRASKTLLDRLATEPRIKTIIGETPVEYVIEDGRAVGLRVAKDSRKRVVKADGFFIFIGYTPSTSCLDQSGVDLSDKGYIITDQTGQTSIKGIFAAGDIVEGVYKQAVIAAGGGATAAMSAEAYLLSQK